MTDTDVVLRGYLARCERIVAGIAELKPFLEPVLPVADDDLSRLEVIERIASIALLKRYEQLQDLIGRLTRTLLSWQLEDVREMTRRDVANWMEKLRLVDDADDWMDYTELRNRLVHEYPAEESEQVFRVNECWAVTPRLIAIFETTKSYLAKAGFPS